MRNFDTELDLAGVATAPTTAIMPTVEVTVEVDRPANPSHTYLGRPDEQWGWEELRDYVVDQIEKHHGRFPRSSVKEASIFKRFAAEWPEAPAIARFAFEVCAGRWGGAPISVNRFCKGSDDFFARPIADRLAGRG